MSWRRFEMLVCCILAYPDSMLGRKIDAAKRSAPVDQPAPPADVDDNRTELTA